MIELRPEVQKFAEAMEMKLRQNDHKGGWKKEDLFWLVGRIRQEQLELEDAIQESRWDDKKLPRVIDEAIDVANFCMMIADNTGSLEVEP